MAGVYSVPRQLIDAIQEGNCIAFVGAGFSAAANMPNWEGLLAILANEPEIGDTKRKYIVERLKQHNAARNEEAAQLLQDILKSDRFVELLRQHLSGGTVPNEMTDRVRLLHGIPFRGILTTNFDDLLSGRLPGDEGFESILRAEYAGRTSNYDSYRRLNSSTGRPTVKLHGDLSKPDSVVFSRTDYRTRLYKDPGYLGFLRSVFLSYTLLYLGFSFTDAYLNELRSEALSIIHSRSDRPVAYAVVNDFPEFVHSQFESSEGIKVLNYDTGDAGDHSGFSMWLDAIHKATNPVVQFGALLSQKRVLWVDPRPESVNVIADGFFVAAAKASGNASSVVQYADDAPTALKRLVTEEPYDLVVSHWGYKPNSRSTAEMLLLGMRQNDVRVPALVFSLEEHANERKPIVQGLGAHGYYFSYPGLLDAIERLLRPGYETG